MKGEEGFQIKINGNQDFRLSKVGKSGAESLYSPFKSIFYELNIDFNKSIFSDIQSMSLFFDELSIVSRLFQNIVLNLNDVSYISTEENFEKILIGFSLDDEHKIFAEEVSFIDDQPKSEIGNRVGR